MPEIVKNSFNFVEKTYVFTHEEILDTLLRVHDRPYWSNLKSNDMKAIELYQDGEDRLKIIVRCKKPL